jgi:hypothetical protein
VDLRDPPSLGGGDLDIGLVRQDADQGRVLANHVALLHEPLNDLALGDAFADVGESKLVHHRSY